MSEAMPVAAKRECSKQNEAASQTNKTHTMQENFKHLLSYSATVISLGAFIIVSSVLIITNKKVWHLTQGRFLHQPWCRQA